MTDIDIDELIDLGIDTQDTQDTHSKTEVSEIVDNFEELLDGFDAAIDDLEDIDTKTSVHDITKKYESISNTFGVASESMKEDMEEILSEAKQEVTEYNKNGNKLTDGIKETAFDVIGLANDFSKLRKMLMTSLENANTVQNKYTEEMSLLTIEDTNPEMLKGYAELMRAFTTQASSVVKMYKDVSETQVKLKQFLAEGKMDDEIGSNTSITNNTIIMSTSDIVKGFNVIDENK